MCLFLAKQRHWNTCSQHGFTSKASLQIYRRRKRNVSSTWIIKLHFSKPLQHWVSGSLISRPWFLWWNILRKNCSIWMRIWFRRILIGISMFFSACLYLYILVVFTLVDQPSWGVLIVSFSLLTPLWMNSVKILHQISLQEDSNVVYFQRLLYTLQVSLSA